MQQKLIEVFWQPWDEPGLEHLQVRYAVDDIVAESTLIRITDGVGFHATYRIHTDTNWRFRRVDLTVCTDIERSITLVTDGNGNWQDGDGVDLLELKGCYEIDISATPFTNTLAIGRMGMQAGQSAQLSAAYIRLPELSVQAVPQRYTALAIDGERSTYRYEGLSTGFKADLPVDENLLVLDYPGVFKRIVPQG